MAENKQVETTEKKTNKERIKDITDSIEKGIKELFESDKYKEYLSVMSRFHRYSVNNQMLIYMQKPSATLVAGFNKWHDNFGRNVKKGEKGIKIIAPTPFKKKVEETKLDPDTKLPMLDDSGNPIKEEKEVQIPMFRVVSVFDVSQTYGKPLPQLASDLSGNVKNYDAFMEAIKRSTNLPVTFENTGNADGYFSVDEQKIVIREGMSEAQTVSALLHELAHSKLHNEKLKEDMLQEVEVFGKKGLFSNDRIDVDTLPPGLYCYDLRASDEDVGIPATIEESVTVNHAGCIITTEPMDFGDSDYIPLNDELNFTGGEKGVRAFWQEVFPDKAKISRSTEEVQAESISYAVCAYYGIATEENSFGYIASWSKDKDLSELKNSLETINKTSNAMICDIDKNYAEILKERGLDKTEDERTDAMYESQLNYLYVFKNSENTWDYYFYDKNSLLEVDGGRLDNSELGIDEAKDEILKTFEVQIPYEGPLENDRAELILEDVLNAEQMHSEALKNMPDKSITQKDMEAYGYSYDNMLPLTKEVAEKLFDADAVIYMLHYDNTESMVLDKNDITNHDGIFGIEKADWAAVKDNYLKNAEISTEDDYDMIDGIINNGDNKPTVAELEEAAKNGKPISLLDLADAVKEESKEKIAKTERPSLLAKLQRPLPEKKNTEKPKSKEREM